MRHAGLKSLLLTWLCLLLLRSNAWGQDARPDQTRVLVPEGEEPALLLAAPWYATGAVNAVVFSPDGQLVATASDDKTARLWDAKTGKLLRTLEGHSRRSPSSCPRCGCALPSTARSWCSPGAR